MNGRISRRRRRVLLGVLCIVALRLILTADRDLLAVNGPYDEYWYVHAAANLFWGSRYDQLAFVHLPVYPMWLVLVDLFGVPARLAIEVAWLLASGYLAFALQRFTGRTWLGIAAFVLLALHPYTIVTFDRALAETLLTVLSAAVLGAGLEIWNTREDGSTPRRRVAVATFTSGLALAFHTRKEGIVLLAPLGILLLVSLLDRPRWWANPGRARLAVPLLVAPVVAIFATGVALAALNYARWGLFARHQLAAPSYERAMSALAAIDVGRTPIHVTVTAKARALAYEVSPTFKELQPFFDGEPGKQVAAHSARFTGVPGEIGNGWFYWALRDAAATAGWHRRATAAEAKYAAMADEIEAAFAQGRLKRRAFSLPSFIDRDVGKWIGNVPAAVMHELALAGRANPDQLALPPEDASPRQFEEFVAIAGRRRPPRQWNVTGWIIAPAGTTVSLVDGERTLASAVLAGTQRPDVAGAYPFSVTAFVAPRPSALQMRMPTGETGTVALSELREGEMARMGGAAQATLGVDALALRESGSRIERVLAGLAKLNLNVDVLSWALVAYATIGWVLWAAAAGGMAACILRGEISSAPFVFVVTCLAALVARATVLGILDSSSWSGLQLRYMLPVVPVFVGMGLTGLCMALAGIGGGRPAKLRARFNAPPVS